MLIGCPEPSRVEILRNPMTDTPPTRRVHRQSPPQSADVESMWAVGVASGDRPTAPEPARPPAQTGASEVPLATMSQVPRRPALVTAAPAFAPAPVELPPAGHGQGPVRVGWDAGRTSLATVPAPIRPLETSSDVLPELTETPEKVRPLWRHPASIVSMATTLLALIALAVFVVIGILNPAAAASGLTLTAGDDNVRVTWSGPDVPYQLVVVGGPGGETVDVSQLVTGTEAWIPRSVGVVDARSCLVVRPASASDQEVSLDASVLASQGASSACLADG